MDASPEDQPSQDDGLRAKRRRIALACIECRERKRKCDGAKPMCGACRRRKPPPDCIYTDETLKRGSSSYVDSLRARIRELEALVAHQSSPKLSSEIEPNSSALSSRAHASMSTDIKSKIIIRSAGQEITDSADEHDDSSYGLDGMGPQGGTPPPDGDSQRASMTYFGPSSVFGFMRQVQHSTNEPPDELQSFVVSIPVHKKDGQARLEDLIEKVPITLPPRANADALVEGYFTGVHSLYPFLHRGTFESRYSKIWSPSLDGEPRLGADDRIFYSLLNAVFALGVHFTPSITPQDRTEHSELYFNRAIGMLHFGVLAQGSIELVQTLLLLSQYLQSTDMPGLCWNIVGLAIRVAQSIGLHIPKTGIDPKNREAVLMNELRKRLWGGCITLDRVMAMIYGRPLMIAPSITSDFAFPSLDDEDLDQGHSPPNLPLKSARINIFVQSLRLILLLGEVLESFYSRAATARASVDHTKKEALNIDQGRLRMLLDFDATLVSMQKSWPNSLQVGMGDSSPFSSRQALTLRARFLHLRIFLLRPFILVLHRERLASGAHSLETSIEEIIAKNTLHTVTNTCLAATEELIDLIWERTMNATNDMSFAWSWWYNVFYVYNCATVIHVARLFHPYELGRTDDETLRRSYQKCIQCLGKYEPFGAAARRARKALLLLEKQIFVNSDKIRTGSEEMHRTDTISSYDRASAQQPFQISPGGEWDFLASWDSLQFDTSFGLANDPMKWTGGDLNDFLGSAPLASGPLLSSTLSQFNPR